MVRLAAVFFFAASFCMLSAAQPPLEYQVKAAFLLNFVRFVEWPPGALEIDAPFNVCIAGADPFGPVIDQIVEGESVNGHKLTVLRIKEGRQASCQVLYMAAGQAANAPGTGVLTVGEGNDFIRRGGVIAFVIDSRRVRFDINLKAATGAGLKLSSKLLAVARSIER
jgi:hypothetical protein